MICGENRQSIDFIKEWQDWPASKWVEWADSDEYKQLYAHPHNAYRYNIRTGTIKECSVAMSLHSLIYITIL